MSTWTPAMAVLAGEVVAVRSSTWRANCRAGTRPSSQRSARVTALGVAVQVHQDTNAFGVPR